MVPEIQPCCNSMPLGAAWAYYIKVLVIASKWLCTRLNKVTLCFCVGSSRQSLRCAR